MLQSGKQRQRLRAKYLSWRGGGMALVTAAFIGGGVAQAGDHPPLSPTRDAVVTYRFQTEALPADTTDPKAPLPEHQVTASFAASGDRLRIDPDNGKGATILNRPAQVMTIVNMEEHRYMQFRPLHGMHSPFFLDLGMTYRAGEMERIADTPCRHWYIESPRGKAQACVTEDGLILSEDGVDADGISGHMRAISVHYGDLPADRFDPPAGFVKFNPFPNAKKALAEPVPGASEEHVTPAPPAAPIAGDQPATANDSVGDGSVSHSDQPQ